MTTSKKDDYAPRLWRVSDFIAMHLSDELSPAQLVASLGWQVTKTVAASDGVKREVEVHAVSLLDSDGLWWVLSHAVDNFMSFPPLAGFTQAGANLVDESYLVSATANWYFMIASTLVLTALGWWVTAKIVDLSTRARGAALV